LFLFDLFSYVRKRIFDGFGVNKQGAKRTRQLLFFFIGEQRPKTLSVVYGGNGVVTEFVSESKPDLNNFVASVMLPAGNDV
jgi:hypothetical protein